MIDGAMQDYPLTLDRVLLHAARWHPRAEVVTAHEFGTSRTTYGDLLGSARRVSAALARLGVAAGEKVATLAWNTQAHLEAWYGILGMGAVCHTLNPRLTAPQLAAMVRQSGASVLLASGDLLALARTIAAEGSVRHLLAIDAALAEAPSPDMRTLSEQMASDVPEVSWGQFSETSPHGLCFTSGTTGAPKGVTYTHRGSFLHMMRLLQTDGMALSGADSVLAAVPMFHANAWGLPFAVPATGGKLVLPGRRTDGPSLARSIASEETTIAVGVPTLWLGLVEHVEATGTRLPSLQRIIVGGSPLAPSLMARLEAVLDVAVQTTWGMTELSPCGTVAPLRASRSAMTSGKPAIGVDLLLTDADGVALVDQRGAEGRLKVRGMAVVERYHGHDAPAVDADGWFDTGDLATIDAEGNLRITGRAKDLIKSGGEWINPAEIEALVGALPEVAQVAVIGRADPKWGERPVLLVELRGDLSDEELLRPLRERVAAWWTPDAVVRLVHMPVAPTGKIDKIKLRAMYGSLGEEDTAGEARRRASDAA